MCRDFPRGDASIAECDAYYAEWLRRLHDVPFYGFVVAKYMLLIETAYPVNDGELITRLAWVLKSSKSENPPSSFLTQAIHLLVMMKSAD